MRRSRGGRPQGPQPKVPRMRGNSIGGGHPSVGPQFQSSLAQGAARRSAQQSACMTSRVTQTPIQAVLSGLGRVSLPALRAARTAPKSLNQRKGQDSHLRPWAYRADARSPQQPPYQAVVRVSRRILPHVRLGSAQTSSPAAPSRTPVGALRKTLLARRPNSPSLGPPTEDRAEGWGALSSAGSCP
jgi:hypothetical protein